MVAPQATEKARPVLLRLHFFSSAYPLHRIFGLAPLFAVALQISFAEAAPKAQKPTPQAPVNADVVVQSRPLIAGDLVKNEKLRDYQGNSVDLHALLKDKYTVLIYSNPDDLTSAERQGYFQILDQPLKRLGYQFVLISSSEDLAIPSDIKNSKDYRLLIDESHASFEDMGLADIAAKRAATRSGIFLIDPKHMILFEFSSASKSVPLSSEVLILAARVYRDHSKREVSRKK